jgi:hypothetical protein
MDPKMLDVLMISWTAFLFFAFLVCWSRYRLEILRREVEQAHAMQSLSGAASSVNVSNPAVSSRGSQ